MLNLSAIWPIISEIFTVLLGFIVLVIMGGLFIIVGSVQYIFIWLFVVTHGHFFECPACWLSSQSYIWEYLPWRLKRIGVELGLAVLGVISVTSLGWLRRLAK